MAKQEKGTAKPAKLDQTELRKLWRQPSTQWITLLNTLGAQNVKDAGDTIKLQCPYHPDNNPSGTIHVLKGYFRCYACGQYTADPIKFVNKYLGTTYSEVARTFRDHFKLEKLDVKKLDETELEQYRMKLLSDVFHQYACNVWVAQALPQTALTAVKWLKNRGITSIDSLGCIGMLPTSADLQKMCAQKGASAEDIQWCMRVVGDYLNVQYMNAVVYTYAKSPDEITAFKLRIPGPDKDSIRFARPHDDEDIGAFGINFAAYYKHYNADRVTRFYAVEGEHDALAMMQGMLDHCPDVDAVFIALSGSGHNGLDFMSELGFAECRLIGDDDSAGESYPLGVLAKTRKIALQVFKWPQRIRNPVPGKIDPDEAIKAHTFPVVHREFHHDKNYEFAARWCLNRADTQVKNIHPDNVIGLQEVGAEYTGILKNDAERQLFAEEFAKLCPAVPSDHLLRQARLNDDSVLGFVEKIKEWITSIYQVTTWNNQTGILKLWHRKRKHYLRIQVDQKAAITQFKRYIDGGNLFYWVRDEIGIPSYFPSVDDPEAAQSALNKVEDMIERDLQRAFSMLSSEAIDEDSNKLKGQGIHLANVPETGIGYIVNGNRVFRLKWTPDLKHVASATEIDGPVDGNEIFDLEHKRTLVPDMTVGWTKLFQNKRDLTRGAPIGPHETFNMVHRIIDTGFEFRNQDVDSMYCAGLVFYNYVYDIISSRRMLTHFYAQHESGKTTLLSVTSNHNQLREFSLCDHAVAVDSFTQAAFYQMFTHTRLVAALDEMNDPNDGSIGSRTKKLFYERCRNLATSGFATLNQGTIDGTGRSFNIHTNVVTASGTVIHDAMDESRFNTINLRKNPNRMTTRLALRNLHSPEEIETLRESIFLHCLHMAPLIHQHYVRMYKLFAQRTSRDSGHKTTIYNVDRFTENLMPLASILEVFGHDGVGFIDAFRESRKEQVRERTQGTPGHALIDTILTVNFTSREDSYQSTSIKSMLLNRSERENISSTNTGVYFDSRSNCLGIVWSEVKLNLLRTTQYKLKTAFSLKADVETVSEWIVDRHEAIKLGITRRLMAAGMTSASEVYTIITVDSLIRRHEQSVKELTAGETEEVVEDVGEAEIIFTPPPLDEGDPLEGID